MRTFTLKGLFLTAVFMLLGCLSIQAANDDLITKQITIKLDKAGTLPDKITSSEMYKITNLKITGEINGTDFRIIREMAGRDYRNETTKGKLSILDLSEAKIVEGGNYYYSYYKDIGYTSNDKIGDYAFKGCSRLTSINLPSSITEIGDYTFKDCNALKEVSFCINDDLETYLTKGHPYIKVDCGINYYLNGKEVTSIVIPSSVTSLGNYAFQKCSTLQSVYVSWSTPISAGKAFKEFDTSKCTLYVPQGTEQDYWLADVWGDFGNIVEYDPTGIDKTTTSTDVEEVSRYSVNGQRLVGPTKGLNIVKYSDGSVKKVAVE